MSEHSNNTKTVFDILQMPFASEFKILAGSDAITNKVSGGNIMDNPKALDWFSPEEILITSGYFLTNDEAKQKESLDKLKQFNISAIFIKELTFFEKIPQTIIDYCDVINLPLIEVPYGLAFATILTTITNALSSHIDEEKQLSIDSHNRFFQSALNGGGVNIITKDLALLLNSTTIVVDSNWSVLAYDKITDEQIKHFTINDQSLQFDLDALEDLPLKIESIKHIIYRSFTKEGYSVRCAIAPIFFNTLNYGYIIVVSTFEKLTTMDHVVMESASMALALQISQKMELERNSNRVIRDFFKQLISGEMIDQNLLKTVGIDIDYNAQYSFIIFNIDIKKDEEASLMKRKQMETNSMKKTLDDIRRFTKDADVDLQTFKQSNKIFGFYKKDMDQSDDENLIMKKAFFNQLLTFIHARSDSYVDINIMIGSAQSVPNLKTSYEEAQRIVSFKLDESQHIFFYNDFFLELFLAEHIDDAAEKQFYTHFLMPLIQYDETNKSELVKTLKEYLYNQFNVADTARKLFIHRNTMLYRIGKIEEILNVDLQMPKTTLSLQLAFEFYEKMPLVDQLF